MTDCETAGLNSSLNIKVPPGDKCSTHSGFFSRGKVLRLNRHSGTSGMFVARISKYLIKH